MCLSHASSRAIFGCQRTDVSFTSFLLKFRLSCFSCLPPSPVSLSVLRTPELVPCWFCLSLDNQNVKEQVVNHNNHSLLFQYKIPRFNCQAIGQILFQLTVTMFCIIYMHHSICMFHDVPRKFKSVEKSVDMLWIIYKCGT